MTLEELCRGIQLQPEVADEVLEFYGAFDFSSIRPHLDGLKDMATEAGARRALEQSLGQDERKFKMLTCMLVCAVDLYAWYQENGISDAIFFDTMKCFPRFLEECRQMDGRYAFDREWWTARQIGGRLFRIGELEYEISRMDQKPVVSIHIPSDAVLSEENCDASLRRAGEFMAEHFAELSAADYVCDSWLLAPELRQMLSEGSRILAFQNRFLIRRVDYGEEDYIGWVFRTRDTEIGNLPEDTSLQRKMKRHLLNGGKVGTGFGVLRTTDSSEA